LNTNVEVISKLRQVHYDVYANLPVVNVAVGDLGFATDRGLLYRWSGAVWQAITSIIPTGLISIWHGAIADIPAGFVICDGNASTPNLLARFVEGVATAATNPGTTGGATAKTTAGHVHNQNSGGAVSNVSAGAEIIGDNGSGAQMVVSTGGGATKFKHCSGVTNNTDGIADIRPLYYDVAFLMKT